MLVEGFPALVAGTNCWVIAPGPGEQCVIVDPGVGIDDALAAVVERHRLHPVAVLLTHGHLDHTFSVLPVCQARGVPAYIHPDDRRQLTDPWWGMGLPPGTPLFGVSGLTFAEPDDVRELDDGARVDLAGLKVSVSHAPGHTAGSVVFGIDEMLLSGDVLFAGSIGRVDLPGGSMADMQRTLREVILPLPDELTVYPGHGPATTIGQERATNPFLRQLA